MGFKNRKLKGPEAEKMELDVTEIQSGLEFPEGPAYLNDGSLLFVQIKGQKLSRLSHSGQLETVAELPGGPNGLAIGPDGKAYVCNNGGVYTFVNAGENASGLKITLPGPPPADYVGGSIQKVDLTTGAVQTLYESCGGERLQAPDDIVFDQDGGFWFTCTGFQDDRQVRKGGVFYATTDGSFITKAASITMANGIGISPDGTTLYVSDTIFGRLWALTIDRTARGKLKPGPMPGVMPGKVIGTLPGFQWLDSLKVEAGGSICVGTLFSGGITIFDLQGNTEFLRVDDTCTTNLCFGGSDMQDVWITASSTGRIFKARWPRPGLKLLGNV
jgi:gluconolactonase